MKSILGVLSYLIAGLAGLGLASYIAGMVLKPSSAAIVESPTLVSSDAIERKRDDISSKVVQIQQQIDNAKTDENLIAQAGNTKPANSAGDDIIIDGQDQNTIDLKFLNEEYKYNASERKDPFKPYEAPRAVFNSTQPIGPMLPLQRFNVEELSVQGIIWGVENPTAMVMAPDKKIYYVKEREKIGKNNGYIAQIREGEVVIVESFLYEGEITSQVKILPIDTVSNAKK
ncbi:MAG: pilus assembly protein PilP [Bdellovibrionota bacterium]|nr:pilus assembly protein PilP [Bdellovibrionota bacterium]